MMYGHSMGAGWTLIFFAVVLPVLVLAAGLILTRTWRPPAGPAAEPWREAEQILAGRLARSEIEVEEYQHRLHALHAGGR